MRITDSSNISEQLNPTVIKMNELLGFTVPFYTILNECNNTIRPLFDVTYVQENTRSTGVVECNELDDGHSFGEINYFLEVASAYTGAVDEIYALQNAGIRHTLIFQWGGETLTMVYNPVFETYPTDIHSIKFE